MTAVTMRVWLLAGLSACICVGGLAIVMTRVLQARAPALAPTAIG
jgi:hypothetical protein